MSRRTTRSALILGAALLLAPAACSDSTGVTGDSLSTAEAFTIFAELQAVVATALGNVTTAPPAGMAAPMTPLPEVTGACDGGGSVTLSGEYEDNIDPETDTGTFSFTFLESIDDCIMVSGGTQFTVNGAPNVIVAGNVEIDENYYISGTYEMTGSIRYEADDGRSGTCAVDVTGDFSTRTTTGNLCGKNISS